MSNLSEKDLLEKLSSFPKHELSTEKRTEMLRMLSDREQVKRVGYSFSFHRIASIAAVFLLLIIAPVLYLINNNGDSPGSNSASQPDDVKQNAVSKFAEADHQAVNFALMDHDQVVYPNSNIGIPNKVSILAPKDWVARDYRYPSTSTVFVWGDNVHDGDILNIEATHLETGISEQIDHVKLKEEGSYDAKAHAVIKFPTFDKHGMYRMKFTLGSGEEIGAFDVYAKQPYVLIGKSTLLVSLEDLQPGFYENKVIEVVGENLPKTIELELFNTDNGEVTTYPFKLDREFTKDGRYISSYIGDFQIRNSGKYRFSVLKESQPVIIK